jgi:DNA helicase-4
MTHFSPGYFGRVLSFRNDWSIALRPAGLTYSSTIAGRLSITEPGPELFTVKPGLIWATVRLKIDDQNITLRGLTNKMAAELQKVASALQQQRQIALYDTLKPQLTAIKLAVEELRDGERYVRQYLVDHLKETQTANLATLPKIVSLLKNPVFQTKRYADAQTAARWLASFFAAPDAHVRDWNQAFVAKEMQAPKWRSYFQNVESSALTEEQQESAIILEDRNLLIAAAGSGKSSTLVAKIGYAIEKGYAEPHEILALAFNNKAAVELDERIGNRLKKKVQALTFHKLGSKILKEANNNSYRPLAKTREILAKVVAELKDKDPTFLTNWMLFKAIHWQDEPDRAFKSVQEYENYIRSRCRNKKKNQQDDWGIPSLKGEPLKSFQELAIANWLFVNQIGYTYEAPYEHAVQSLGWSKYEPDFLYELADGRRLYHEHFALRADGTSPFGQQYVDSANQKRALHKSRGTLLIETTSAQFESGTVFAHLKATLNSFGLTLRPRTSEDLAKYLTGRNDQDLIATVQKVIIHAKESGFDKQHMQAQGLKQRNIIRARAFLDILFVIWDAYNQRLVALNQIDFADMIGTAASLVLNNQYACTAKIILVDEFQDMSPGRARLIEALLKKVPGSVLFGVGDDWQAINQFAGSDLSIMRHFATHFGKTETRYLRKTFRSNQGISDVSSKFVMKNPSQIRKDVFAGDQARKDVIRVVEYTGSKMKESIETKLDELAAIALSRGKTLSVLIIGRYKYETTGAIKDADIDLWNAKYSQLTIKQDHKKNKTEPLDTVHKSKGLEADFVLVHSMQSQAYAFPSEMEDDPLMNILFSNRDGFSNAEERRLFYVALTRAKEQVTLFTPQGNPSRFVLELLDAEYDDNVLFEGKDKKPAVCQKCKQGYMRRVPSKKGQYEAFISCSSYHTTGCTNKVI